MSAQVNAVHKVYFIDRYARVWRDNGQPGWLGGKAYLQVVRYVQYDICDSYEYCVLRYNQQELYRRMKTKQKTASTDIKVLNRNQT